MLRLCLVCGGTVQAGHASAKETLLSETPESFLDALTDGFIPSYSMTVAEFATRLATSLAYPVGSNSLYLIDKTGTVIGSREISGIDGDVEQFDSVEKAREDALANEDVESDEDQTESAFELIQDSIKEAEFSRKVNGDSPVESVCILDWKTTTNKDGSLKLGEKGLKKCQCSSGNVPALV